jgi:hypothetical protein
VNGNAIAVFIIVGRGHDWAQWWIAEFPNPLQSLRDLPRFPMELMLVADVLIAAPAAPSKIRAGWRHTLDGRLQDGDQLRFHECFLFSRYSR